MTNQNTAAQAAQGAVKWANTPGAVEHFPATARAHINGLASLLLSKLRAPVAEETQALHDHDLWFQEYGQTLGAFHNSLTIHTRAAWVAASRQYAALASAPVAEPKRAPVDDGIFWSSKEIQHRQREEDEARAAYYHSRASAPVAGYIKPDPAAPTHPRYVSELKYRSAADAEADPEGKGWLKVYAAPQPSPVAGEAVAEMLVTNIGCKVTTLNAANYLPNGTYQLYAAPQASECECSRKSKAVSDSEAQL